MPRLPLTVTADNKTILLGDLLPQFTATLSGFIEGDTATSTVIGNAFCTSVATSSRNVGLFPIECTIGTLDSEKYAFTDFIVGALQIKYRWSGFLSPINDVVYHPKKSPSAFRAGNTISVKFQLKDGKGKAVRAVTDPIWLTPQRLSKIESEIINPPTMSASTTNSTYRFSKKSSQYEYNWDTKRLSSGYWYRIYAKLDDGSIYSVVVGLK